MKAFVFILALFIAVPSVGGNVEVDLARGLEKAARGELRDRALLEKLQRAFSVSKEPTQQIQIANVLTYAPESSGLRERYVEYVLSRENAASVLGRDELFRLRRLRAERLFEAGKFLQARVDFEFLMQVGDPLVQEYAVLKTGWCSMNVDKPQIAWQLWIEQAEKTLERKKPVPPNLAHSLGQALVENPKRTSDDFQRLGQLNLDEAARTQVGHGMEQGSDTVDTPTKMREWVESARALKWAPALAGRLLEQMGGTGTRSCLFLPWVTLLSPESKQVPALAYQVTENCLVWLQAGAKNHSNKTVDKKSAKNKGVSPRELSESAAAVLSLWLPNQPWSHSQLRVPFAYYAYTEAWVKSCQAGLTWISQPGNPDYRGRAPITDISEVCKKAVGTDDGAKAVVGFFEPTPGVVEYLGQSKDPLLFTALALLESPAFEKQLLARLLVNGPGYQKTLLPVLVLERLEAQKQVASAESLWEGLVVKQADDASASSVWRQILLRRVKQWKDSKASTEVLHALLTRTLNPPTDPKLSEFGYGLWLQYLAAEVELARKEPLEAERKLLSNSVAKSTADGLLNKARTKAYPKMASASVEMMAWFGMWAVLWDTLTGPDAVAFSSVRSEALEVRLLSSLVKGESAVAAETKIADPALLFIVDLGGKLKNSPTDGWLSSLKPRGNTIVARDATYLLSMEQRQERLLVDRKSSKAAAQQALDWIQFLDRQKRDIARRTWCHEIFFHRAQDSLVQFCDKAQGKLPTLKKAVQGAGSSESQWQEFFDAFEKKLDACKSKADVRRASL